MQNQKPDNFLSNSKNWLIKRPAFQKVAIVATIAVVFWFGYNKILGTGQKQPQFQTAQAQKGTIISTVTASGTVLTTNIVNVTTSATGVVNQVYVENGQIVSVGQKIAEVTQDQTSQTKNAQAMNSYLQAKTSLDSANAESYSLRSAKDTAWKKFYDIATSSQYQNPDGSPRNDQRDSSAVFQSAQGDWLAAEARYKNQTAVIGQIQQSVSASWLAYQGSASQITAPIAGTIENITVIPGMVLAQQSSTTNNSNQRIGVIKNNGNPTITVNLSETDVTKVKPGQKATVTLSSMLDKTFTGKVQTVDKIGTVTSNVTNYPAIIQLDTGAETILPNMAASASIIIDTKEDVVLVPAGAVQNQNGQPTVRILKNGEPQTVAIETGLSSDSQIEIISGVSEEDEVITGTTSAGATTNQQQGTSPFGTNRPGGGFGGLR